MQEILGLRGKAMRQHANQVLKQVLPKELQQRIQGSLQRRQAMLPHRDSGFSLGSFPISLCKWREIRVLKTSN